MSQRYFTLENYNPALSSCSTMGFVHDMGGYKQVLMRQSGGKDYVVVNFHRPSQVEKYGAFSLRAAVRPPYAGYAGYGCAGCRGNCGCNCVHGGPCNCSIIGVT